MPPRLLRPLACAVLLLCPLSQAQERSAPSNEAEVKTYLLEAVDRMKAASEDLVKNSTAYAALVDAKDGDVAAAHQAGAAEMDALIVLRDRQSVEFCLPNFPASPILPA